MKYKFTIVTTIIAAVFTSNCITKEEPVIEVGSSDFLHVLQSSAFVDKSLLIKNVLKYRYLLITAPRRFGKTSNMNMIKRFLEIELDENGNQITKVDYTRQLVIDTLNYQLFKNLKINMEKHIMIKHFGSHPVIHADFKCDSNIGNYNDALSYFKEIIHKTYKMHFYLIKSNKLTSFEKRQYKMWYEDGYENFTEIKVVDGLRLLSELLYKHFNGRQIFVLIDEYDSVITTAMFKEKNMDELDSIIRLSIGVISAVLKSNCYVDRGLITGISYIAGVGLSGLNNIKTFRFLENHIFVKYYGLTRNEIDILFSNPIFKLNQNVTDLAHKYYNGYVSKTGQKIYNLFSIINFLEFGSIDNYWTQCGYVKNLEKVFHIPAVKKAILILLQGKSIKIDIHKRIRVSDIATLRNLLSQPKSQELSDPDLFLSFLLELGYLTCVPQTGILPDKTSVRIPNEETKQEIYGSLKEFYIKICKFDKSLIRDCALFFDNLSPTVNERDKQFIDALQLFHKKLKGLFRAFSNSKCIRLNEDALHSLMYFVSYETKYRSGTEFNYIYKESNTNRNVRIKLDLVLSFKNFGIIVELKHKKSRNSTSAYAIQQIINEQYYRVFQSEELRRHRIKYHIFIGIAIDDKLNPHISCLINSYDISKAIHVPKLRLGPKQRRLLKKSLKLSKKRATVRRRWKRRYTRKKRTKINKVNFDPL